MNIWRMKHISSEILLAMVFLFSISFVNADNDSTGKIFKVLRLEKVFLTNVSFNHADEKLKTIHVEPVQLKPVTVRIMSDLDVTKQNTMFEK